MLVASSFFLKNVEDAPCSWVRRLWGRFSVGLVFLVLYSHRRRGSLFLLTLSAGAMEISRIFRQEVYGSHCRDLH